MEIEFILFGKWVKLLSFRKKFRKREEIEGEGREREKENRGLES